MIYGVGTDLVEISRIENAISKNNHFLERFYTEKERRLISPNRKGMGTAAMNFAGKEAVAKALGTGICYDVRMEQIEILRKDTGEPIVVLHGNTDKYAQARGIRNIFLSLSDTDSLAVAYAVAEAGDGIAASG